MRAELKARMVAFKEKLEKECDVACATTRQLSGGDRWGPLISIRSHSSSLPTPGPRNPIALLRRLERCLQQSSHGPLIAALLPAIAFTARRQICADAIVSAANAIAARRLPFYSASFICRNKVAVF